jgi:hypothetical protein
MLEEKRTNTREGKRPWEAGFEAEEAEQKAEARAEKGDDKNAIKDSTMYSQTEGTKK